jgi:hypothetical protein
MWEEIGYAALMTLKIVVFIAAVIGAAFGIAYFVIWLLSIGVIWTIVVIIVLIFVGVLVYNYFEYN